MITTSHPQFKALTPEALYFDWIHSLPSELQNELYIYLKHHTGLSSLMELFSKTNDDTEECLLHVATDFLIQRAKGIPLQYLLGEWDFFDFTLKIDNRVFIPRPETELLVEFAAKAVCLRNSHPSPLLACDVGTGSGCIPIALAKRFAEMKLYALDISGPAIQCARENGEALGIADRVCFLQGDLFEPLKNMAEQPKMNLIVSNPPYIPTSEITSLQKEVLHEPVTALDGGLDGLQFYRRIAAEAKEFLADEGNVFVEAGYNASVAIKAIFAKEGFLCEGTCRDHQNIERCLWFAQAS